MAQKVIVTMLDDIDGSEAVETVTFGLDGNTFEIDLNAKNADKLRNAITKYSGAARKVRTPGAPVARRRSTGTNDRDRLIKVREWARENGHSVSDRGRISQAIFDAYDAAN